MERAIRRSLLPLCVISFTMNRLARDFSRDNVERLVAAAVSSG